MADSLSPRRPAACRGLATRLPGCVDIDTGEHMVELMTEHESEMLGGRAGR